MEATPPGQNILPQCVETTGEIVALMLQYLQPVDVLRTMIFVGGSAIDFRRRVVQLQLQNRQPVDDQAGCFRVQRSFFVLRAGGVEEQPIDLFDEVVAPLIDRVDGVLDGGDCGILRAWIARLVFLMPQIEVGLVLSQHQRIQHGDGGGKLQQAMPLGGGGIVQLEDGLGLEHGAGFTLTNSGRRTGVGGLPYYLAMGGPIKRVLIYRLGSMGDTVVALPAFHLVARAFPDAERRLLTNRPINEKAAAAAAILDNSGLVSGYFDYEVATRNLLALGRLWWDLVRWRPQAVVYLGSARGVSGARRDSLFFRVCGITRQYGVPLTEDMQRNRRQPERGAEEYEAARLVRNIAELGDGAVMDDASWDLRFTPAERARATEALLPAGERPVLAISLGTKVTANNWGRDNWRKLLLELGRRYPECVLAITGVTSESADSEYAAEGWRESAGQEAMVLNLCGKLTPRESAAVFARARAFMGHDSGPMHLADAVATPVMAVFSARNPPTRWFPHGARHHIVYHKVNCHGCGMRECTVEQMKCVKSITVEEVLAAACAAIEGRVPKAPPDWLYEYSVPQGGIVREIAHAS